VVYCLCFTVLHDTEVIRCVLLVLVFERRHCYSHSLFVSKHLPVRCPYANSGGSTALAAVQPPHYVQRDLRLVTTHGVFATRSENLLAAELWSQQAKRAALLYQIGAALCDEKLKRQVMTVVLGCSCAAKCIVVSFAYEYAGHVRRTHVP
jgi:hypothetical protein